MFNLLFGNLFLNGFKLGACNKYFIIVMKKHMFLIFLSLTAINKNENKYIL